MRRIIFVVFLLFPVLGFSQVLFKAGAALGNRWDERLNSQTLGKGFRVSGEKFIIQQFAVGLGVSYFSFSPTKSVNVRFNSYSLLFTYFFNTKKWQPYLGTGAGYTKYVDKTTINLSTGINSTQTRNKNYGVISPLLGLQYNMGKRSKIGFFMQANADFIPVVTTQPIGFVSIAGGLTYRLPTQ